MKTLLSDKTIAEVGSNLRKKNVSFKQIQDLKSILRAEPFNLSYYQNKVGRLVGMLTKDCLPSYRDFLCEGIEQMESEQKSRSDEHDSKDEGVGEVLGKVAGMPSEEKNSSKVPFPPGKRGQDALIRQKNSGCEKNIKIFHFAQSV